jgi:hypothetical protein
MEMQPVTDPVQEAEIDVNVRAETPASLSSIPPLGYDLSSCASRFLSSALSGFFLDILILCVYGAAVLTGFRPGTMGLLYTLIEVPVIWGILGIFFYNEMLDLAGDVMQRAPFIRRWYRFGL